MEYHSYGDVNKTEIIHALEQLEYMIGEEEDQQMNLESNFNHMYLTGYTGNLEDELGTTAEVTSIQTNPIQKQK